MLAKSYLKEYRCEDPKKQKIQLDHEITNQKIGTIFLPENLTIAIRLSIHFDVPLVFIPKNAPV